jgi:hypothetical protein
MFGIPSVAVVIFAKAGLHLAKRQKWLPKNFYHRLSLDSLRSGDFEAAAKYNALARQKDPAYEKAQVVHDLLRMNRDAHLEEIRAKAEQHMFAISRLRLEKKNRLARLQRYHHRKRELKWRGFALAIVLLLLIISVQILGIRFHFKNSWWLIPALASGVLILFLGQRAVGSARECLQNEENLAQEVRSSLKELNHEMTHHRHRLQVLGAEMIKIRAKTV